MSNVAVISNVRKKYQALAPFLHEKARRCWAACEALALGRGGISAVASATALSRPTIRRGIAEVQAGDDSPGDIPRQGRSSSTGMTDHSRGRIGAREEGGHCHGHL